LKTHESIELGLDARTTVSIVRQIHQRAAVARALPRVVHQIQHPRVRARVKLNGTLLSHIIVIVPTSNRDGRDRDVVVRIDPVARRVPRARKARIRAGAMTHAARVNRLTARACAHSEKSCATSSSSSSARDVQQSVG
jgi:hypothetical protein